MLNTMDRGKDVGVGLVEGAVDVVVDGPDHKAAQDVKDSFLDSFQGVHLDLVDQHHSSQKIKKVKQRKMMFQ